MPKNGDTRWMYGYDYYHGNRWNANHKYNKRSNFSVAVEMITKDQKRFNHWPYRIVAIKEIYDGTGDRWSHTWCPASTELSVYYREGIDVDPLSSCALPFKHKFIEECENNLFVVTHPDWPVDALYRPGQHLWNRRTEEWMVAESVQMQSVSEEPVYYYTCVRWNEDLKDNISTIDQEDNLTPWAEETKKMKHKRERSIVNRILSCVGL